MNHEDLFGPIPPAHATYSAPSTDSPQSATRSEGLALGVLVGALLCVVLGAVYAAFALRVGYIFSIANVAIGHVMGRVIRQRIGRSNAALTPIFAVAFTYAASAMLFLPFVYHGLADWNESAALQQQNLSWVRGHEHDVTQFDGTLGFLWLIALTLKAPILAGAAGHPMPLIFTGLGLAAAIRASLKE
jgi:hypothetical protein